MDTTQDQLVLLRKEKGEAWKKSRFETEGLAVLDDKEIVEVKKEWRRKKIEEEQRKLDEEGIVLVDNAEGPVAETENLEDPEDVPTEEDMATEDEEDRDAIHNLVEQMLLQESVTENAACERVRDERVRDSDIFGRRKPRLLHPREPVVKRPRPPNLPRAFRVVAPFPGPWSPWNSESEEEGGSEEEEAEQGEEEAGPTEAGPTN